MSAPVDMRAVDFETFAAKRGLSMSEVGDAGAHKRGRRQSDNQWNRIVRLLDERSADIVQRRNALRAEYDALVAEGLIRPLKRLERLQLAASGHPDLESTKAAQRILVRVGGAA